MTSDERNPYAPPGATSSGLNSRSGWPWWVRFGAFGISGRRGLWAFFILSLASAVGFFGYGFWDARSFAVAVASLWSALMYWLTLRWIDRHGSWTTGTPG